MDHIPMLPGLWPSLPTDACAIRSAGDGRSRDEAFLDDAGEGQRKAHARPLERPAEIGQAGDVLGDGDLVAVVETDLNLDLERPRVRSRLRRSRVVEVVKQVPVELVQGG